jgi:pyruvate dehydrogenase E1 component
MKCKGFLLGGTAGRTTLNGEGLQHQDGHSHLIANAFPAIRCYDPAYAYESATIVMEGMREMYERDHEVMYYITLHNENYKMPAMPVGSEEGIIKGIYRVNSVDAGSGSAKVQIFGSGAILRCALGAQQILAEKYGVSSNVWSVTSYKTLWTEANDCEHWNLLHPGETPRKSYLEKTLEGEQGPFIATSDNVRMVAQQIEPWVPGDYYVLGCDGVGRSDRRVRLRRHFEVDAECTALAALTQLAKQGKFDAAKLPQVIKDLGIDPEKANPVST